MSLLLSVGQVAPIYNIVLAGIALYLMWGLFSKKFFSKPWKFLFFAVAVFLVESAVTASFFYGFTLVPRWYNAVFELAMVIAFIYMLLIQLEHVKKKRFLKRT